MWWSDSDLEGPLFKFGDYPGVKSNSMVGLNLANAEDMSRSKAEDHDRFLMESLEMSSGQKSWERLEWVLPKIFNGKNVCDRF